MRSPVMGSMNYESNYPSIYKAEELSYSGYQHIVALMVMKGRVNNIHDDHKVYRVGKLF